MHIGALHAPLGLLQEGEGLLNVATAGINLRQAGQRMQRRHGLPVLFPQDLAQGLFAGIEITPLQVQFALQDMQAPQQGHVVAVIGMQQPQAFLQ
ncbi:hypothetical protein D9M73_213240 [compost metagenome]